MKKQIVSMKRGAQKGFTLIELMIVITIIGILAAFAVPMFQDYTIRTRVGEGLVLASSAKNLVVDNAVNGFDLANGWINTGTPSFEPTENTQTIAVSSTDGKITITSSAKAKGVVLYLTPFTGALTASSALASGTVPEGRIGWKCTYGALATGTLKTSWVPSECRSS